MRFTWFFTHSGVNEIGAWTYSYWLNLFVTRFQWIKSRDDRLKSSSTGLNAGCITFGLTGNASQFSRTAKNNIKILKFIFSQLVMFYKMMIYCGLYISIFPWCHENGMRWRYNGPRRRNSPKLAIYYSQMLVFNTVWIAYIHHL